MNGLLGGQMGGQMGGLLGGQMGMQTQDLMSQYLQNLFMRRYNPPAIGGQGVTSQMGPGGMQYMAPQMQQQAPRQTQQAPQQQPGYGPPGQDWGYM